MHGPIVQGMQHTTHSHLLCVHGQLALLATSCHLFAQRALEAGCSSLGLKRSCLLVAMLLSCTVITLHAYCCVCVFAVLAHVGGNQGTQRVRFGFFAGFGSLWRAARQATDR